MKKLLILALAASFVFSAALASAATLEVDGGMRQTFQWSDNTDFKDNQIEDEAGAEASEDDFAAVYRIRMYFDYVASENLHAVVAFELDNTWGDSAQSLTGDHAGEVELKNAYTAWTWPGSDLSFSVGLQGLTWPSISIGHPVYGGNDVFSTLVSYPFNDMVGVTAGWVRFWDPNQGEGDGNDGANDEVDAFTVIVPITADGFSLAPYVIYAKHGKDAAANAPAFAGLEGANNTNLGDDLDIWYGGANFGLTMFDPFVFGLDVVYGAVDGDTNNNNDREGWYAAAELEYKMDMFTPGLVGWWGTGEDDDPDNGSERLPVMAAGSWAPSYLAGAGGSWQAADGLLTGFGNGDQQAGTWAIGLRVLGLAFVENLSHDFYAIYGGGTSDSDIIKNYTGQNQMLTEDDSFWELSMVHSYSVYEDLSLILRAGLIGVDLDEDTWEPTQGANFAETETAGVVAFTIKYSF